MSGVASSLGSGRSRKRPAQLSVDASALECPVCLDVFNTAAHRPLSLACGHSVCAACSTTMGLVGACPICRTVVRAVGPNYTVLQLLDQRAALYACQACERRVEAEDAWICGGDVCSEKAVRPRIVFLACSRCFLTDHQGHPRVPLPRAIQLSKAEQAAKFKALEGSLKEMDSAELRADRACERLSDAAAAQGSNEMLERPRLKAVLQLKGLSLQKTSLSAKAEAVLGRLRRGELDPELLEAAAVEPEELRRAVELCGRGLAALASRAERLTAALAAFAGVAEAVAKEASDADPLHASQRPALHQTLLYDDVE